MTLPTSSEIDAREFRNCCGRFATGITIVTTQVDGATHGMTANGFMSVSLHPPLIAVSLGHHTKLHALLSQSMRYGISILGEAQLKYSNHFAGRPDDTLAIPFIQKAGMPLLEGSLAHLVARVVHIQETGDHSLYIAQVEYLEYNNGRPLLYYAGGYNHLKADPQPDHMTWYDNELFFFPIGSSEY
jgi:flavin reductase (DIM6/NTAB) family NADH-FMN oxidoreductase RutF